MGLAGIQGEYDFLVQLFGCRRKSPLSGLRQLVADEIVKKPELVAGESDWFPFYMSGCPIVSSIHDRFLSDFASSLAICLAHIKPACCSVAVALHVAMILKRKRRRV